VPLPLPLLLKTGVALLSYCRWRVLFNTIDKKFDDSRALPLIARSYGGGGGGERQWRRHGHSWISLEVISMAATRLVMPVLPHIDGLVAGGNLMVVCFLFWLLVACCFCLVLAFFLSFGELSRHISRNFYWLWGCIDSYVDSTTKFEIQTLPFYICWE